MSTGDFTRICLSSSAHLWVHAPASCPSRPTSCPSWLDGRSDCFHDCCSQAKNYGRFYVDVAYADYQRAELEASNPNFYYFSLLILHSSLWLDLASFHSCPTSNHIPLHYYYCSRAWWLTESSLSETGHCSFCRCLSANWWIGRSSFYAWLSIWPQPANRHHHLGGVSYWPSDSTWSCPYVRDLKAYDWTSCKTSPEHGPYLDAFWGQSCDLSSHWDRTNHRWSPLGRWNWYWLQSGGRSCSDSFKIDLSLVTNRNSHYFNSSISWPAEESSSSANPPGYDPHGHAFNRLSGPQ